MFELSLYRLTGGADSAAFARHGAQAARALFDDEPAPPLLGGVWSALSGTGLPMVCMLTQWADLAQRDRLFPRLCDRLADSDDESPAARACDTWLMTPNAAWAGFREPAADAPLQGVHELRILPVLCPSVPDATQSLATVDLPLFKSLGARVLGVFDAAIGADMPAVMMLLAWPDFAAQQRGAARADVDPRVWRQRDRETAALGRPLFGVTQQYLLEPDPHGAPRPNLGVQAEADAVGWWGRPVEQRGSTS